MSFDQFWSIFAMPIGLMICFTPMVVAWLSKELKSKPEDKSARPQPQGQPRH